MKDFTKYLVMLSQYCSGPMFMDLDMSRKYDNIQMIIRKEVQHDW